jgi:hypothetical protein
LRSEEGRGRPGETEPVGEPLSRGAYFGLEAAQASGPPASVGAGTRRIRTGDRLRIDGGNGRVTILQEANGLI